MKTLLLVLLASGSAHDEKMSFSRVEVISPRDGVWTIEVALMGLDKIIRLPAEPLDMTDRDLQSIKKEIVDYLLTCMSLEINGKPAGLEAGAMEPVEDIFVVTGQKYIDRARVAFRFRSDEDIRKLAINIALFSTKIRDHKAVFLFKWGGKEWPLSKIGPSSFEVSDPSFWATFTSFLVSGMHHIFIGFDHIAFLLALLLAAQKMGEMIRVVTSFTVAHSLTLLLAALDVIRLEGSVTEALIAASIVYVAVENVTMKQHRHRWALSFVFGLVHGLGFSSVLKDELQVSSGIVLPVVSFNIGVELGQIAILLVAFPILSLLRKPKDEPALELRQRRILWIGSVPIFLFGLGWLIERVFHREFMPL